MKPRTFLWAALLVAAAFLNGQAQSPSPVPALLRQNANIGDLPLILPPAPVLPLMSPELALDTFENRSTLQGQQLGSYSDTTIVVAHLPDTKQSGEFELMRTYSATPKSLAFTPVKFQGDGFVKSNIIVRLLQSEADHVTKDDPALTAISPANYKFKSKGSALFDDGRLVYIFEVKPHKKRPGLFKGRIFVDAYTGAIRRAEGSIVKSPSFFIKKVDFVQEYSEVSGFVFPVHLHTISKTRIIGRAIVDIFHRDYKPEATQAKATIAPAGSTDYSRTSN
jgi:hypothetical protein